MTGTDFRTYEVGLEDNGTRLDKFLSSTCDDLSRTRIKQLILDQAVDVDDDITLNPSLKLKTGQIIHIEIPPAEEYHLKAENIPLDIIYEDDDLLVINKDADMVVHPAAGNWNGTLVHALLYHCGDSLSGIGGVLRPGIVHRLDKGTSGLMMVAKHDQAHQHLSQQLSDRTLKRTYHAVVLGIPTPPRGIIDKPLGRHSRDRLKITVRAHGKEARTHYELIENFNDTLALIECHLETGRTHQIRVHMESIGHALIGDPLYGPQPTKLNAYMNKGGYEQDIRDTALSFPRQALHAARISFLHPRHKKNMQFEAAYPDDFENLIDLFQ